jgi:hypothetical protein
LVYNLGNPAEKTTAEFFDAKPPLERLYKKQPVITMDKEST